MVGIGLLDLEEMGQEVLSIALFSYSMRMGMAFGTILQSPANRLAYKPENGHARCFPDAMNYSILIDQRVEPGDLCHLIEITVSPS